MSEANGEEIVSEETNISLADLLESSQEQIEEVQEPEPIPEAEPSNDEQVPIQPEFVSENGSDDVTEEELDTLATEIEETISGLESEKAELEGRTADLETQLSELLAEKAERDKLFDDNVAELKEIEDAWQRIQNLPVLGELVRDALMGKEVNIPEMIKSKMAEDASSFPNIDQSSQVSVPETPKTLQDVFSATPTIRFD